MPNYFYKAKSFKGELKSGTREAKSPHELAHILRQEGYLLISADLKREEKKGKFTLDILSKLRGVPLTEKMFFTRNLRIMIEAGIPLPRCIETLALQTQNKRFRSALLAIKENIIKGESLSDALSGHPDIFSELFINMVKVGEESGTLENVFKNLSLQMERNHQLKSSIMGAMMYPAVIISAMLGIGILMLIMVVPNLAKTFKELNVELPWTTQLIMALGTLLVERWYLVILGIVVLVILLKTVLKRNKRMVDSLVLKIPIVSPIIKKLNSAYTVRTLSSLIASGVPIVRALEITSRVLGNVYFREAIAKAGKEVRKGGSLSDALSPYTGLYPLVVIQMVKVGEETGETSGILGKLADFYEEDISRATKNLTSIIEPIIILIVGGAVGFFAISMVQPMYSMLGAM